MDAIKCGVLGDNNTGKTCLLVKYTTKEFPKNDNIPTVFDDYIGEIIVDGRPCLLELYDSTSHCAGDHLRQFEYKDTDIFLICFSVVEPTTFESVWCKWFPQIKRVCPDARVVVVGTKTDLRDLVHNEGGPVTTKQGQEMAYEVGANEYLECSALGGSGVAQVFLEAARIATRSANEDGKCVKCKTAVTTVCCAVC